MITETVKDWLANDLNELIDDAEGTLGNEKLWLLGSTDPEAVSAHAENIQNICEYIGVLGEVIKCILEA